MENIITIRRQVVKGEKRGKLLGYPTANLRLYKRDRLKRGVWATAVKLAGKQYNSVTYVGAPVSFDDKNDRIEVYIFGYKGNLYGKVIGVGFIKWLRGVKRFRNKETLVTQIKRDCAEAREVLKTSY